MSYITIRNIEATDSDLVNYFKMYADSLIEEVEGQKVEIYPRIDFASNGSEFQNEMTGWVEEFHVSTSQPAICFLFAEYAGEPVGFIKALLMDRSIGKPKRYVQVIGMYVKPSARKKISIAKRLTESVRTWYKVMEKKTGEKVGAIEVTTVCNEKQLKKWQRKGYKPYMVVLRKEI